MLTGYIYQYLMLRRGRDGSTDTWVVQRCMATLGGKNISVPSLINIETSSLGRTGQYVMILIDYANVKGRGRDGSTDRDVWLL